VLHFTVPFANPAAMEAKGFAFAVLDPEFFIAFELAGRETIKLCAGTPKGCAVSVGEPEPKPGDRSALGELQAQLGGFGGAIQLVSVDCNSP
jgi:ABC-type uncharacterized transport system substrate-binding protein